VRVFLRPAKILLAVLFTLNISTATFISRNQISNRLLDLTASEVLTELTHRPEAARATTKASLLPIH
jgi:hypothetical protein